MDSFRRKNENKWIRRNYYIVYDTLVVRNNIVTFASKYYFYYP